MTDEIAELLASYFKISDEQHSNNIYNGFPIDLKDEAKTLSANCEVRKKLNLPPNKKD